MRHLAMLLVFLALAAPARSLAAPESPALAAARHALQEAVNRGNADDLQAARAAFVGLQADEPRSAVLPYWVALCCWRAEPVVYPEDADAARRLCVDGIAACDRAFAADPRFGEALAMKASLQALSLTFVPSAAMTLGPEMDENFARARQLEPANPRVFLLHGIYLLHKPAQYGGGPDKARPVLETAVKLGGSARATARGIDWGRDDAHLWLGRCLAQSGDWAGARERFRDALQANPANGWVKARLLPEAERHLAAPADSQ